MTHHHLKKCAATSLILMMLVGMLALPNVALAAYSASDVLGQPDFTTGTANSITLTEPNKFGLFSAEDMVVDPVNHRLFVADISNNRVLEFDLNASNVPLDYAADHVLGQPDFVTKDFNATQNGLHTPAGLAYDSANSRLFVGDNQNNRVVVFDVASITDGENAVNVIGQANFTSSTGTISQNRISSPAGVAYDATNKRLFVSELAGRVTVFDVDPAVLIANNSGTDGPNAINVIGSPNFTTAPGGAHRNTLDVSYFIAYDSNNDRLFVAEEQNNRVTVFDVDPAVLIPNNSGTDGPNAINVIGQSNYTSNGHTLTQNGLYQPIGAGYDANNERLFVVDGSNNRITVYNVDPAVLIANNSGTDGPNAINVIGQPNFTSNTNATTQNGVIVFGNARYDGDQEQLFAGDSSNNRITVYNVDPAVLIANNSGTDGPNAINVIGQTDGISPVYTTSQRDDLDNSPVSVLGDQGFSLPSSEALDTVHHRLFVTDDANNRVLEFDLNSNNDLLDHTADHVLGQTTFSGSGTALTQNGFSTPQYVAYDSANDRLFVSEFDNNRVLVFDVASITDGENAINVIGQANFTTNGASVTQKSVSSPVGLAYDSAGKRLFVADRDNHRVMVFNVDPAVLIANNSGTDNPNAINVLGHTAYNGSDTPTDTNGFQAEGIAYDATGHRLFVGDEDGDRVLVFDVSSITNGENAVNLLGHTLYDGSDTPTGQNGFISEPVGVEYDATHSRLFVSDDGANRITVFDVASITDGENATAVIGQNDFTSSTSGTTQDTLSAPIGMAYDSGNNRLYAADIGNNRVMIFNLATISTTSLPDGAVGTSYSQTIATANTQGTVTFAVTAGAVPTGLSLNGSTGELSGTPTASGSFSFTVTATDDISPAGAFTDSQDYTITIVQLAHTDIAISDITFGTDGTIFSTVIGADGNTYVGGDFTHVGTPALYAATFNTGTGSPITLGTFDSFVGAVISDGSGGWYVGGNFTTVQGVARNHLVHILSDESVDPAFDPNLDGDVDALVLDGTTLYAGGNFTDVNGGTTRNRLAAFDTTTGIATSFDPNVGAAVFALVLDGTTLYAGGPFIDVNGGTTRNNLAAFDTTTGTATSFDPNVGNGSTYVAALALNGTTLYAGGIFANVNGGTTRNHLAAFDTTTGTATSFDPSIDGVNDAVFALVLNGTTLYTGGQFATVNSGTSRNNLAAFNTTTGTATSFNPNIGTVNAAITALVLDGTTLYAGGQFTDVNGGTSRSNLVALDTTTGIATSFAPNPNSNANALALSGTTLYAGGGFTLIHSAARNRVASFVTATGDITALDPDIDDSVRALVLDGTTLYVGGNFTDVNGGTTRNHLAAFDTTTSIATSFDPNVDINVYALALGGTTLYVGGDFTDVNGGTPRNDLAAFDTATGIATSFDPSVTSSNGVYTLLLDGTTLYAGGFFDTVNGGTTRNSLAAFDITTGIATAFDPDMDSDVYGLVLDGTTLYVGGDFSHVNGGTTRNFLAAFDTGTAVATSFDPNMDGRVQAIGLDGTTLYAGGSFTNVNGTILRNRLAAFDTTSGVATDFNPNLDATAWALSIRDTNLAVGGDFTRIGSLPRLHFALFDIGASPTPTPTPSPTPVHHGGGGTPTPTPTPSVSPSPSVTPTASPTPSATPTPSLTPAPTPMVSVSPTPSVSPVSTLAPSSSPAPSPAPTSSSPPSVFPSAGSAVGSAIASAFTAIIRVLGGAIPVVAPVVALAAAIPILIAALAAALTTGSPVSFALSQSRVLMEVIGLKRRRRIWGSVYDSRTKRPIPYAKVELYDQNKRLLETRYADRDGRYGFLTSPQSLHQDSMQIIIVPSAPGYSFPSGIVTAASDFIVYDHLYRGETVTIAKDMIVNYNIALDPTVSTPTSLPTRAPSIFGSVTAILLNIAFWVGIIALPINAIRSPSVVSISLLAVFLIANGIRISSDLYRPYGLVTDSHTHLPVPYALVTVSEPNGKRLSFAVSDERGRYFLIISPGTYLITVYTPAQVQPPRSSSVLLTTRRGWIRKALAL